MSKWDGKERRDNGNGNGNGRRQSDENSVLPECDRRFNVTEDNQKHMRGRIDKIYYLIITLLLAVIGKGLLAGLLK